MLSQYSNIDEILNADQSLSGLRLTKKQSDLLAFPINKQIDFNDINPSETKLLEFHVYANDNWITGNHTLPVTNESATFTNTDTNEEIRFNAPIINIDLFQQFDNLKLTAGNYRFVINFFENLIGSYALQYLKVDEISPDRTEVRLKAIDKKDPQFLTQINNYINTVNQTAIPNGFAKTYLLNFSRNQTFQYVNSVVIGEFLYVKLLNPLPDTIEEQFKCWVVQENKYPYIDNVVIYPKDGLKTFNTLSGPNWQANNQGFNVSAETNLKTWNDLLGSSTQTSQEIVDAYFSGSLSEMTLNIDYTDFNNFIFYSSATERLENFKYKLQLLELYTSQSNAVSELSGSVAVTNVQDFTNKQNKLTGGFDNFEQFLYYQSSSGLFTQEIPLIDPTVPAVTGSYITPAPKSNSSYPYTLYSVSSSQFTDWYDSVYISASKYDIDNNNALIKAIPQYILLDQQSTQLSSFVNMLGQHYDILYTYINAMTRINKRDEHPKLGMPNELLYSVAKQFGWNLQDGNQNKNLWEYTLGTDESGTPLTGSNSVENSSMPSRDMTYNIWRRIVNNIPGLLKSKGTKRSIQALLACYGVPQSLITIKEYGGPRLERRPIYEQLNFDYALDLITNPAGTVTVNYDQPIDGVELRFRTDNILTNPTMSSTMNLYNVGSNSVTIDFSSGTKGTIQINGTSSAAFECFNGDWVNTILRSGSNGTLEIVAKKSKYGKIVSSVSASATASLPASGTVTLGSTSTGATRLEGQLQELRLWTGSLLDDPMENHTKAPAAYDGNVDAYDELVFRVPLTQKIDHSLTSSLSGVEPNPSGISASFASWTNDTPYDSIEEMYYYDGISLGAGTFDDNKIRLESNNLVGALDVKTRAERSQFDTAPLDSKKLGVYYSPQTMINEDIIAQLGFTSLDDYIGDPGDQDKRSYPDLIRVATEYWKKYTQKNDINAYIKIFSLFDLSFFKQLEQLLPARADKITGLLIQPNLLERSKDTALPDVNRFVESYDSELIVFDNTDEFINSEYLTYTGSTDTVIATMTANDDDQLQGYLTSSQDNYNGTTYCYPYLIRSGSGWLQVSSSYWLCEGVLPTITSSRCSEYWQTLYSETTSSIQFLSDGLNRPKAAGQSGSAAGVDWEDTGNITSSIGITQTSIDNQVSKYLAGSTFEFSIPSDATVIGVEVQISRSAKFGTGDIIDNEVRLTTNVAANPIPIIGDNKAKAGIWQTDPATITYGGSSDTWGYSWTPSDVNNSRFGVLLSVTSSASDTAFVNSIQGIVYYKSGSVASSQYQCAEVQDYLPIGTERHEYLGCSMTSPDFNIDSTDTIDGGPVVEFIDTNPNQIITQTPGQQGGLTIR